MTSEQLSVALEKLEALHDSYKAIESVPIPDSIKDAVKDKWELTLDTLQLGVVLAYLPHERATDRQRLIRFGDALDVMEELEEALIEKLTKGGDVLILGRLYNGIAAFRWLANNWRNLELIWKSIVEFFHDTYRYFVAAIPLLVDNVLVALSLPTFALVAKKALKVRDSFPSRLRAKALPQRRVHRVQRRKVARL